MKECVDCGQEINPRRVEALPGAETCVSCQADREDAGYFVRHKIDIKASVRCGEVDTITQTIVRAGV